jgi:hypothetical protein
VHPDRAPRALRLRGSARKFVLDPERRDPFDLGDVRVRVQVRGFRVQDFSSTPIQSPES